MGVSVGYSVTGLMHHLLTRGFAVWGSWMRAEIRSGSTSKEIVVDVGPGLCAYRYRCHVPLQLCQRGNTFAVTWCSAHFRARALMRDFRYS